MNSKAIQTILAIGFIIIIAIYILIQTNPIKKFMSLIKTKFNVAFKKKAKNPVNESKKLHKEKLSFLSDK